MQTEEFQRTVEEQRAALTRFVAMMVGADSEEIVQDAIATAWNDRDRFERRSRFSTWLFGIARNLCRSRLRTRREQPADDDDLAAQPRPGHGILTSVIRHEMAERIEFAVSRLPEAMREAFCLHYIEGLDYEETAAVTGVSAGTARVRAFRARALLRDQLGDVVDTAWRAESPERS